jgi:hypothetical protein
VENEAWDGSIEKIVRIIDAMDHDDTEEDMFQAPTIGQCTVPSTRAMKCATQTTPVSSGSAQSTPRVKQIPTSSPSSSTSRDPPLASLLPKKTRSLRDIYNEDTTIFFSIFFSVLTNRQSINF